MTHELTKQQQYTEFVPGQVVDIDGRTPDPALPTVMGQPAIAELSLGGVDDQPPARMLVLSVADKLNDEYREVARRGSARSMESDFALVAIDERNVVTGVSFLPKADPNGITHNYTVVGRRSGDDSTAKARWIDFGAERDLPKDWTPFDDNPTVSRSQVALIVGQDKVSIMALPSQTDGTNRANSKSAIRGAGVKIAGTETEESPVTEDKQVRLALKLGKLAR